MKPRIILSVRILDSDIACCLLSSGDILPFKFKEVNNENSEYFPLFRYNSPDFDLDDVSLVNFFNNNSAKFIVKYIEIFEIIRDKMKKAEKLRKEIEV